MKKVIVSENQRGLLFRNGRYVKLLGAGKYYLFGESDAELLPMEQAVHSSRCSLDLLLADPEIAAQTAVAEVDDGQMALHYVNGRFQSVLKQGKYAFWTVTDRHEFKLFDITSPEVELDVPAYIRERIPPLYYVKIEVAPYQKARLYFDQKLVRLLDAGTYYFWRNGTRIEADYVDTRLTQMNIAGQEILTQDKVTIRVNFVLNYRITDYVKSMTEIDDFAGQIHVAAQLALREYVSRYRLDDILANKEQMSEYAARKLREKAPSLYVEITDAGVKDIILPGEIREIMNTVLVAEKRAQANVITRREEVASTRSLLNTAKLMEENQTLYKLKELEYAERICEKVGNINLNGSSDVLTQLTGVLRSVGG